MQLLYTTLKLETCKTLLLNTCDFHKKKKKANDIWYHLHSQGVQNMQELKALILVLF